jgi:hypothetical protein
VTRSKSLVRADAAIVAVLLLMVFSRSDRRLGRPAADDVERTGEGDR